MDRREAIRRVAFLMGGTISAPALSGLLGGCKPNSKENAAFQSFSPDAKKLVAELAETFIPETSTPGAKAAKVDEFIVTMIEDCYPEKDQKIFFSGLDMIEAESNKTYDRSFIELQGNERIEILKTVEKEAFERRESFVATDNREGGRLGARRLIEVLGGKGKVILLRYTEGSASTTHREEGFLEEMKKSGKNIELISANQYAGVTIEKAFQVAQNLLNRYPDVEGVFCPNETSAQGMLRALQTSNKAGKVKLIGFDANETLVKAMENGHIHGLALQDPFNMGYLAVKTATQIVKGEKVERRIDTGVQMVTPDNMKEKAVQVLLYPEIDKWLQ